MCKSHGCGLQCQTWVRILIITCAISNMLYFTESQISFYNNIRIAAMCSVNPGLSLTLSVFGSTQSFDIGTVL